MLENIKEKDIYNAIIKALKIQQYIDIQNMYGKIDVTKDKDFQRIYKGYYRLRRDDAWCKVYFNVLKESNKSTMLSEILNRLYDENKGDNKKVELSFATKLMHTINPNLPIYDSHVANMLKLDKITGSGKEKIESAEKVYRQLQDRYKGLSHLADKFDKVLSNVNISKTKKIDTVLYWQVGDNV